MKNYTVALIFLLGMQTHYAGNLGFSLTYRPPLFNCAPGVGCSPYKFAMSPVSKINNASTKDKKVYRGEVLTEQHFIGYWAPTFPALYIFAPLNKENNVYGNSYTALDVYIVSYYWRLMGYLGPIINWKHSQDTNIGLNGSDDGGFAQYLYSHYFKTEHHDRTWPLFQPATNGITEISYQKFKPPVGTIAEYFSGTSSQYPQVLAYWPLHMIDPLELTYPDKNDQDGFNYKKIRSKITNYKEVYKDIGF